MRRRLIGRFKSRSAWIIAFRVEDSRLGCRLTLQRQRVIAHRIGLDDEKRMLLRMRIRQVSLGSAKLTSHSEALRC
jgi:hypothetical protein